MYFSLLFHRNTGVVAGIQINAPLIAFHCTLLNYLTRKASLVVPKLYYSTTREARLTLPAVFNLVQFAHRHLLHSLDNMGIGVQRNADA